MMLMRMSEQPILRSTKKSTKTRLTQWAEKVLTVWFTAIMLFFAGLGMTILVLGVRSNMPVAASLGSALFSTSTISAIFKVVGFDLYMTQKLSDAMKENNEESSTEIQSLLSKHTTETRELVNQSITRAFSDTGFVEMLSETQCREVFRKSLAHMKKGMPSPEIYEAFQKLSESLVGLVSIDRRFSVMLEYAKEYGPQILRSTVNYSAKMVNQSPAKSVGLFPNGLVTETTIETPRELDASKLQKPEELGKFVELQVNGKKVEPDEIQHSWVDENDKKKGAKILVKSSLTIPPKDSSTDQPSPINISTATEALLDETDYVLRRFTSFAVGSTLTVNHPEDLEAEVTWFRPEEAVVSEPMRTNKVLEQRVDGVFLPGMGFMLRTRKRTGRIRKLTSQRKTQEENKPTSQPQLSSPASLT